MILGRTVHLCASSLVDKTLSSCPLHCPLDCGLCETRVGSHAHLPGSEPHRKGLVNDSAMGRECEIPCAEDLERGTKSEVVTIIDKPINYSALLGHSKTTCKYCPLSRQIRMQIHVHRGFPRLYSPRARGTCLTLQLKFDPHRRG